MGWLETRYLFVVPLGTLLWILAFLESPRQLRKLSDPKMRRRHRTWSMVIGLGSTFLAVVLALVGLLGGHGRSIVVGAACAALSLTFAWLFERRWRSMRSSS